VSVNLGFLAFTTLLSAWAWKRDKGSLLSVSLLTWVAIALSLALHPVRLAPVTAQAAIIVGVGLVAMTVPVLRRRQRSGLGSVDQGDGRVAFTQLVIATALTLAMVGGGVYAFHSGVASATGSSFGQLTIQQVRTAQTGSARGGGLVALLAAADPILACLGVYGAIRYSRAWVALVIVALLASLQTPARLMTIMLIVQTVVFYLYCRAVVPRRRGAAAPSEAHHPPMLMMAGGVGVALTIFSYIGSKLGKTSLVSSYFPEFRWPSWILSVILYGTGGPSALSTALRENVDPTEHPNSIFTLTKLFSLFDPSYKPPDTLASYVPIPIPFNVYTGFGQIYFDFGLFGVIVLAFILGWAAVSAHRRAQEGYIEWAWVASVLATSLLTLPQTYRLFFLDVDFQLVVGFAIFWAIRRGRKNGVIHVPEAGVVGFGSEVAQRTGRAL